MRKMLRVHRFSRALVFGALLTSTALVTTAAHAAGLAPLTKLRLTVVQFVASTGDYRRWDALGGEIEVGPDLTVIVPTLGAIDVAGLDEEQLGTEIARRLKAKLGLIDAPDATIQVVEYPPVYVVGSVSSPGQFAFRPGMTVIQALALAGGETRVEGATSLTGTIRLEADLNGINSDILRATARLARLNSEYARERQIAFPAELDEKDPRIAQIMEQERRIFTARINGYERQQSGLTQLSELLGAQIGALEQKAQAIEDQTTRAQQQVDSLTKLVASGSATVSRLNDAQRVLSDLRSDKFDNLIAAMSARESMSNTQRELAKLEDDRQANASVELQTEQAGLERLLLNQDATARLLRQSVEFDQSSKLASTMKVTLTYSIVRQQDSKSVVLDADEASPLLPGDLVKVTMQLEGSGTRAAAASLMGSEPS